MDTPPPSKEIKEKQLYLGSPQLDTTLGSHQFYRLNIRRLPGKNAGYAEQISIENHIEKGIGERNHLQVTQIYPCVHII